MESSGQSLVDGAWWVESSERRPSEWGLLDRVWGIKSGGWGLADEI